MQIIDKETSANRKSSLTVYHWLSADNIILEILASCLGWNEPGWLAALLVIVILAVTEFTMVFGFKKHSMTLGAHSVMTIGVGLFTLASACYMGVTCGKYGIKRNQNWSDDMEESPCLWMFGITSLSLIITVIETVLLQVGVKIGFENLRKVLRAVLKSKRETE